MTSQLCSPHHSSSMTPYHWWLVSYPTETRFHWRLKGMSTDNEAARWGFPENHPCRTCSAMAQMLQFWAALEHLNQDSSSDMGSENHVHMSPARSSEELWVYTARDQKGEISHIAEFWVFLPLLLFKASKKHTTARRLTIISHFTKSWNNYFF